MSIFRDPDVILRERFQDRIEFDAPKNIECITGDIVSQSGSFQSLYRYNRNEGFGIKFEYKYFEDETFSISVQGVNDSISYGEVLAALSSLYVAIKGEYDEPVHFNTSSAGELSMTWELFARDLKLANDRDAWSFIGGDIHTIFFDGKDSSVRNSGLTETERRKISTEEGLPFELVSLISKDPIGYYMYRAEPRTMTVPVSHAKQKEPIWEVDPTCGNSKEDN